MYHLRNAYGTIIATASTIQALKLVAERIQKDTPFRYHITKA